MGPSVKSYVRSVDRAAFRIGQAVQVKAMRVPGLYGRTGFVVLLVLGFLKAGFKAEPFSPCGKKPGKTYFLKESNKSATAPFFFFYLVVYRSTIFQLTLLYICGYVLKTRIYKQANICQIGTTKQRNEARALIGRPAMHVYIYCEKGGRLTSAATCYMIQRDVQRV